MGWHGVGAVFSRVHRLVSEMAFKSLVVLLDRYAKFLAYLFVVAFVGVCNCVCHHDLYALM